MTLTFQVFLKALFAIDWKAGSFNLYGNRNLHRLFGGILRAIEVTINIQCQFYHVLMTVALSLPSWPVLTKSQKCAAPLNHCIYLH